jgi:hypothetical protein
MKENAINFGNWLSKNYQVDDGIGYWIDSVTGEDNFTTEQLYEKFTNEIVQRERLNEETTKDYIANDTKQWNDIKQQFI